MIAVTGIALLLRTVEASALACPLRSTLIDLWRVFICATNYLALLFGRWMKICEKDSALANSPSGTVLEVLTITLSILCWQSCCVEVTSLMETNVECCRWSMGLRVPKLEWMVRFVMCTVHVYMYVKFLSVKIDFSKILCIIPTTSVGLPSSTSWASIVHRLWRKK